MGAIAGCCREDDSLEDGQKERDPPRATKGESSGPDSISGKWARCESCMMVLCVAEFEVDPLRLAGAWGPDGVEVGRSERWLVGQWGGRGAHGKVMVGGRGVR